MPEIVRCEACAFWGKIPKAQSAYSWVCEEHYAVVTGAKITEVWDLELSVRALNCLTKSGFTSISQIKGLSDKKLLRIRNCGPKTVAEIREVIRLRPKREVTISASDWIGAA